MRNDIHLPVTWVQPDEHPILDQIRNDHELMARLRITPQELAALSRCVFLGSLTCKGDMLFILRQIREATSPSSSGEMFVFPQPAAYSEDEEQEDPLPDFRQIRSRLGPHVLADPGPLEGLARRRLPARLSVLFLAAIIPVGLVWSGIIAIPRWRDILMTRVGMSVSQTPASEVWFNHLDRFGVLLSWEAILVVGIIGVIYLRSLKGTNRLKVRPVRRY